jgi:hypothetical protein
MPERRSATRLRPSHLEGEVVLAREAAAASGGCLSHLIGELTL